MKDNVDKRVVEFELNNKKFNKDVDKTTKHLKNLEDTLQFKDVSKSIDNVDKKMSAFGVAAATTVMNITNRVVDLGIKLIKSLSVDNISAGWTKFGDKTKAVGTLMAQTLKIAGKEIENAAEQMTIVNEQLEKLNFFTDETSYNFIDMVDNIGKFTAAGIDLDKSVKAMEGIANWAALSGQNAATASRAMYQLSQALGKGYVQLIDYKSIQNANMDTQEFRQTVLDTAVAMGELTKEGQNYITKAGTKFTKNQFTEQLASKWFTSDVLTKSLEKYSSAVDKLYEITEREGITAAEAMEKYADEFDEFGLKAMKAAQECRTLADALNAIKDAVSTNWMTTFEQIFGGYNDAKTFWSDISNSLYEAFVTSGQFRNEILKTWNALEGRATLFAHTGDNDQGAFWNIVDAIESIKSNIKDAWQTIFPKSDLEDSNEQAKEIGKRLKTITTNIQKTTKRFKEFWENNERLKNTLTGVFSILRTIAEIIVKITNALSPILYVIKQITNNVLDIIAKIGEKLSGTSKILNVVDVMCEKIYNSLTNIFSSFNLNSLSKIKDYISNIGTNLKDGIVPALEKIGNAFKKVTSNILNGISNIKNKIESLFEETTSKSGGRIGGIGESLGSGVKMAAMAPFSKQNLEKIDVVSNVPENIVKNTDIFKKILKTITETLDVIKKLLEASYASILSITKLVTSILTIISNAFNMVTSKLEDISTDAEKIKQLFKNIIATLLGILVLYKTVSLIFNTIWDLQYIKATIFSAAEQLGWTLGKFANSKILEGIASTLKSLGLAMIEIALSFSIFDKVSWNGMLKGGAVLILMLGLSTILFMAITKKANNFTNAIEKTNDSFKMITVGNQPFLRQLSDFIRSIGLTMLGIAIAMQIIGNIEPDRFENAKQIFEELLLIITVMSVISATIGTETETGMRNAPGMLKAIGLVILFRGLIKAFTLLCDPSLIATMQSAPGIVAIIAGSYIVLVAVVLLIAKATNKLGKFGDNNKVTSFKNAGVSLSLIKNNPIAQILFGAAAIILAAASAIWIIQNARNVDPVAFENIAKVFSAIVGTILLFAAIMALLTKNANIKSSADSKIFVNKQKNPVAQILNAVSVLMLSITAISIAMASLKHPWKTFVLMNGILLSVAGTMALIALVSKMMKPTEEKGIQRLAIIMGAIGFLFATIATIFNLLEKPWQAVLLMDTILLSILGTITILALISRAMSSNEGKNIQRLAIIMGAIATLFTGITAVVYATGDPWNAVLLLNAILISILGAMTILALISKLMTNVSLGGIGKLAIVGALIAGVGAAILGLQKMVKVDWTVLGYVSAFLGIFLGLAAIMAIPVVGEFLAIGFALLAAGIIAISASLVVLGAALIVLGNGLERIVPVMHDLNIGEIGNLTLLLTALSAMGLLGIAGIAGLSSIGTGCEVLGWGLERLVPSMNLLERNQITLLSALLLALSATGVLGLFGIIGNSSLGVGMEMLGLGLSALINPMNELKSENVNNLKQLLNILSGTGIKGLFAVIGNSSIAVGMKRIGEGINSLLNSITSEKVALLEYISNIISAMRNGGMDDFVIKPVMDLSNVQEGINSIRNAFSNISNPSISAAALTSNSLSGYKQNANTPTQNVSNYSDTYNSTFNITGATDPQAVADTVDRLLQQKAKSYRLAH